MCDLEDGPLHFMLLLPIVARVLGVLHLVGKLKQSVLDVVESIWRGLPVLCRADGWHLRGIEEVM